MNWLAHALSRTDHCSSLLAGIISEHTTTAESTEPDHAAARLLFHKQRNDHVTPLLKRLHWLPVAESIS